MADITKCLGQNCPFKMDCYRYRSPIKKWAQAFINPPYDGEFCELFHPIELNMPLAKAEDLKDYLEDMH